jgi:hypothetical protein
MEMNSVKNVDLVNMKLVDKCGRLSERESELRKSVQSWCFESLLVEYIKCFL